MDAIRALGSLELCRAMHHHGNASYAMSAVDISSYMTMFSHNHSIRARSPCKCQSMTTYLSSYGVIYNQIRDC